ncbi:MAG: hypothetical protein P4L92_02120 [Rudaea sp.]|nr:hypothetical protein [Rudaea sp.]
MNPLRNIAGRMLLSLLPICAVAQATNPSVSTSQNTLTISQNASGEVVASGSGLIYGFCAVPVFYYPPTFSIAGTLITVSDSPGPAPQYCIGEDQPPVTLAYQESVDFGVLAPGTYGVIWTTLQLEGTYTVEENGQPAFNIGPGITGNWFDPNESGHGFGIEVLSGNTMLAEWFVFGPNGGRDWIIATGPITGDTAILNAFQTGGSGGRFPPNFNSAQTQSQAWGTITFTFTDCDTGQVSWTPTAAGYTPGSIPITRLTIPAGLSCP